MSNPSPPSSPQWRWRHFEQHTASSWHAILQLRSAVFVVEQKCPYQDPDDKDTEAFHLECLVDGALAATLRVLAPGASHPESSIGRVVVGPSHRNLKLGRALMDRGIAFNQAYWGGGIRISAQCYLEPFYHSLGFHDVGAPYLEDDIPHREMLLPG